MTPRREEKFFHVVQQPNFHLRVPAHHVLRLLVGKE
jgi:hypothetical protein